MSTHWDTRARSRSRMHEAMNEAQFDAAWNHQLPLDNGGFSWQPLPDGTFLLVQAGRQYILELDGQIVPVDDVDSEEIAA